MSKQASLTGNSEPSSELSQKVGLSVPVAVGLISRNGPVAYCKCARQRLSLTGTAFCWLDIETTQPNRAAEVSSYETAIIAGPIALCVLSTRERM
jgi:hypothetical protein